MVEWLLFIRVRDIFSVFFWRMQVLRILKAWRNRDTIWFYVVTPKDLRRKRKIWCLLTNRCGIRDTSQVFATHVEEGPNEHGLQKDALVPWWYWKATLTACCVYWRDGFTPLMRETFRVRVCERVGPGFLTTAEILRRKMAWNAEDFFWIYDPTHTLALADDFGFDGKKQLEQTKSILVEPGSKSTNKGLHNGADVLDERETRQCRSLIGTALNVGQVCPETQYPTEESARFMSDPTRAVKCMLKRLCNHYSEAPVLGWSFPYQEMPSEIRAVTDANWSGELEGLRSTSCAWIYFGGYLLETYSSTQQIVALSTTGSEYISITKGVAHALEIRSVLAESDMTLKMMGKTDVTVGRATAARRGFGRVHHLDARLSWLQRLWAEGVMESQFRPGEHNEADLESKMIDSTLLLKGTPLRPPMSSSSWSLRMVAGD